jgi:hypothetical protein
MIKLLLVVVAFLLEDSSGRSQDRKAVMAEINQDNGVYILTDSNFESMIQWNDIVLVCFYADSA